MKISIIGLGWLGLPLAKSLQKKGFSVIGSTTSWEKKERITENGVLVFQMELAPQPIGIGFTKLFEADIMIITIPPKSQQQPGNLYLKQLKYLKEMISKSEIKKVIFISSTGIYPESTKSEPYSESDFISLKNSGNQNQFRAESLFKNESTFNATIIRFGGLMGENRIPGKYFSEKENVIGHTKVNFIHQEDAVRLIEWVITTELWGKIFNGVAPIHSLRKDIYEKNAAQYGLIAPKSYSLEIVEGNRLISSDKIISTGFEFKFPDPLSFEYHSNNDYQ
jgi:nucleoside-diphosphate-sugar epimerase